MTALAVTTTLGVVLSVLAKLVPSERFQALMAKLGYWQAATMLGACELIAVGWWALSCFTELPVPPAGLACGSDGAFEAVTIGFLAWMGNQTTYAVAARRMGKAPTQQATMV